MDYRKEKFIGVRLGESQYNWLKKISKDTGKPLSEVVRIIIRREEVLRRDSLNEPE